MQESAATLPEVPHKIGGSRAGRPNKVTQAAREAIALFVNNNAHKLQEWLEMVALGYKVQATNPKNGQVMERLVPPNPEKAFELFQSVVEYHIPKLTRSTIAGDPDAPLSVEPVILRGVTANAGNSGS